MRINGSETLYTRETFPSGKVRYRPIAEKLPRDTFGPGAWIVRVSPGHTAVTQAVTPDKPGLCAAIEEARDAMLDALQVATRPVHCAVGTAEKRATSIYQDSCRRQGLEPYPIKLSYKSAWDIIDAALKVLKENHED